MIGKEYLMSERVPNYHLNNTMLDLGITIEFCEFDQSMTLTQLGCYSTEGLLYMEIKIPNRLTPNQSTDLE